MKQAKKAIEGNPSSEEGSGKTPVPAALLHARSSPRATGSATVADVASIAGVSAMTVSRVLNNPERVSPRTLAVVKGAIERTGYVPNLLAGGLASRRSRLVAVVVPTIANSMFAQVTQALTDELGKAGYQVMLGLSGYDASREQELLDAILSRRPDGIVLTGTVHTDTTRTRLLKSGIPLVETWDMSPSPMDMLVGFSHEQVGVAVAEYLLDKGYRRFGLVFANDQRGDVRRRGLLAALARHGISDVPLESVPVPSTMGLGKRHFAKLLERAPGLDVVVCSSDPLAQGVIVEAQERGIGVPDQLAVMGFGDYDFAAELSPTLSSVSIDGKAIGNRAARFLVARIEKTESAGSETVVDVGFSIIERRRTSKSKSKGSI